MEHILRITIKDNEPITVKKIERVAKPEKRAEIAQFH